MENIQFKKTEENTFEFLVQDEISKVKFDEILESDESLGSKTVALSILRKYLLDNQIRGNILTKQIEQAYKLKQRKLLKHLLEERFLQLFTDEEFELFLEVFKFNKWTWFELITQFNKRKCNIFLLISQAPM
ncbi:hypothetical protein G8S49_06115 [Clostridium botulinum C]|uniref:Uncharacterized protein n=3 Tax=Clostridium botulinum TaxID=1491 RepID=A0A9P2G5J2_CLOBO|nr:hypothetical protein [Clostridium botulinum]YP_398579.1 hypothetical protein CST149 [Clostridium phage c-st]EES90318.1 conserved hypothetical protein [Clostridium phage D-1873]MCD3194796.1 hypothetical protein [Clostridium botulinum C]MCD3200269.1 hypothetical protein [Clostridium botulinum C]MCD3205664.1 hypothetical protein [Clostridium botulinum C]MCD3207501.1 hypothetical protein [Clostridium botulinum C]